MLRYARFSVTRMIPPLSGLLQRRSEPHFSILCKLAERPGLIATGRSAGPYQLVDLILRT